MSNNRKVDINDGNYNESIQGNYNESIKGDYVQEKLINSPKISLKYLVATFLFITSLLTFVFVKYNSDSSIKTFGDNSPTFKDIKGNIRLDIKGDPTSTAEKRANDAFLEIKQELQNNFQNLSLTIQDVESNKPQTFWDIRRANETELAYQDRARTNFQEYINGIEDQIKLLKFNQEAYKGLRNNLAHDRKSSQYINKVYKQLDEVKYSLTSFESRLKHILSQNLSDQERTAKSDSLQREKMADARVALANAAAHFCLVLTEEIEIKILSESLNLADININLKPGKEGYKESLLMAAQFSQEKSKILQKGIINVDKAKQREVERLVKDPYLALLRKTTGLPPTLSDGEVFALQNKKINQTEKDPEKLFQLAAFSFLESDGHASTIYFEKAIESGSLSPWQDKFARLSINRLKQPEIYEESLGIMMIKLTPNGNFDRAGLKEGDVIVSLNGKTINEPGEISSELGKSGDNPSLLEIIREEQSLRKVINGGESAGATLTQLIILNAIQL